MLKGIIIGAAAAAVVFSGCSVAGTESLRADVKKDDPTVVNILADKDNTAVGFVNIGNVVRNNYVAALAEAAKVTLDHGYKYFTIIEPKEFVSLLEEEKPKNLEEYYVMCDSGKESFHMGLSLRNSGVMEDQRCDKIVFRVDESTLLRGTVKHGKVFFVIRMSNEKLKPYTLDAKEVLNSKRVKELDPDMLKKG